MPFPVRAIGVDNGSEFMADFELACASRSIALLTLSPRSTKLNGAVERAKPDPHRGVPRAHQRRARARAAAACPARVETVYNTVRPHQALGYLTPAEFLASLAADV
jgi:transposase InsO family protein